MTIIKWCLTVLIVCYSVGSAAVTGSAILPGTPFETEMYLIDSGLEGPRVLVLGGVHGDEPAGMRAAEQLCGLPIRRGMLIIIPRVNKLALHHQVRTLPEIGDVNRAYPGREAGTPAERLAGAVAQVMNSHKISMLIDLHEARTFHRLDSTSVGQSVLFAANDKSAVLALAAVEEVNRQIEERHKKFCFLAHPIPGSAAHFAGGQLGMAAFTVETSRQQLLPERVSQHITIVKALLAAEGML